MFVGLDIHKSSIEIAFAEAGRDGEVRSYGAIDGTLDALDALMLRVWRSPEIRPTMDIDMLGRTSNDEDGIVKQIREIMTVDVEPDGLSFDPASVQAEQITEDAEYAGIRIRFRGLLDTARVALQIDIGFGDIVYPELEESDLPVMLDFPAPRLLCYSRKNAIAEKFETMVKLGILNSRMKDFYDI